jgi:predicted metal-binding protein
MKQLHRSSVVHNHSGGGLLKEVMKKLVESDILAICPRGVKSCSRTTAVYIKRLPVPSDNDAQEEFDSLLSEYSFNGHPIRFDDYKNSSASFALDAVGIVQQEVFDLLDRSEYRDIDTSALVRLPTINASKGKC